MADSQQVFFSTVWKNTDNDILVAGDVVVRDTAVNRGVKRTTTIGAISGVGIVVSPSVDPNTGGGHRDVQVATVPGQVVRCRILSGATVARGDKLITSDVEGHVRVDNAAPPSKTIAVAVEAKTGGVGTDVLALLVTGGASGTSGGGGQTLATTYAAGGTPTDQTMLLDSATNGGPVIIDGSTGALTDNHILIVKAAVGDDVIQTETGNIGILNSDPEQSLHIYNPLIPAIRFEHVQGYVNVKADIRYRQNDMELFAVGANTIIAKFHMLTAGGLEVPGGYSASAGKSTSAGTITFGDTGSLSNKSPVGTGRFRYNESPTPRMQFSVNNGEWVDIGTGSENLAATYDLGSTGPDQTLNITDARGGGIIIDASNLVTFTGVGAGVNPDVLKILGNTTDGRIFVIKRDTGYVGIGLSNPTKNLHIKDPTEAIIRQNVGGANFELRYDGTKFEMWNPTTAAPAIKVLPGNGVFIQGGLSLDNDNALFPVNARTITFPPTTGADAPLNSGRIRYLLANQALQICENLGDWQSIRPVGGMVRVVSGMTRIDNGNQKSIVASGGVSTDIDVEKANTFFVAKLTGNIGSFPAPWTGTALPNPPPSWFNGRKITFYFTQGTGVKKTVAWANGSGGTYAFANTFGPTLADFNSLLNATPENGVISIGFMFINSPINRWVACALAGYWTV